MQITGIEVIRGHYTPRLRALKTVEALPGEKLELTYGDKLRINTAFGYRGFGQEVTLYGSIGQRRAIIGFDEIISNEAAIALPESRDAFTPITASLDIPITADIAPKPDYDIYCKIKEYPKAGLPQVDDVITITGIPPTFTLLEETIYPYAYIYDGPCTNGTFTFKSDPFTPAKWIAGIVAGNVESEIRKAGGRIMEMRVFVDKSPLLWTDWRIETVVKSPPVTSGTAMSLGPAWWVVALMLALVIALIIVITWSAKEIAKLFTHNPALKDVKAAWKKETLILTIQDAEEYWKRTPTPVDKLQGMSEEELREYLDKIAEEEAPPVTGLGFVVAIAGVGVLGALAVAAMTMRKPEEIKKK